MGKCAKICVKMLKKSTLSCRPPVPISLILFTPEQILKIPVYFGYDNQIFWLGQSGQKAHVNGSSVRLYKVSQNIGIDKKLKF